jgi:hypothetical protein
MLYDLAKKWSIKEINEPHNCYVLENFDYVIARCTRFEQAHASFHWERLAKPLEKLMAPLQHVY